MSARRWARAACQGRVGLRRDELAAKCMGSGDYRLIQQRFAIACALAALVGDIKRIVQIAQAACTFGDGVTDLFV